jgi:hypothetical protein
MGLALPPFTPVEQAGFLSLRTHDTVRSGAVVHLDWLISRIIFAIKEWFRGGRVENDEKEFSQFYARMKGNIQVLNANFDGGENGSENYHQIQDLLKVAHKIRNSSWGKNLEGGSQDYEKFQAGVEALRVRAALTVDGWAAEDFTNRAATARWIKAGNSQRSFATYLDLAEVPYRFNEIPRGAVILTDPSLYLDSTRLKKNGSILKTIELHVKAFICWFGTGKQYTHAELSLGNGDSFDLDKKRGSFLKGEMKIQSRGDKTCYGAIFVPNEEKMLLAHQVAYREKDLVPFNTFQDLLDAMEKEARQSAPHIKAGIMDLARVGLFTSSRPADYDPMGAWAPGQKQYGCSATTSALFSKFGIDIGKQYGKMDRNVSPADFSTSEFFRPLFIAK